MLTAEPLGGAVGAVIRGIDLRDLGSDAEEIRHAWHRYGVLFFPAQHLSDAEHVEVARIFGEPEAFPMAKAVDAEPLVHVITSPAGPRRHGGASQWHSDASWKPEPPRGSVLRAVELPDVGGDTLFASAAGAYASLSGGLQRMVDELTATHAGGEALARAGARVDRRVPEPVRHPIVRVHPVTGDRCLYVNRVFTQYIDQVPRRESEALLPYLCDTFRDPELQCRYRWGPGDVAVWDNRAVQHYAVPDYDEARIMHRVVLAGEPVAGPA